MIPAWGPPSSLSPLKGHHVRSASDGLLYHRFAGKPVLSENPPERRSPDPVSRKPGLLFQFCQFLQCCLPGIPDDPVIARMHLQKCFRLLAHRPPVILRTGPVRGSHFAQRCSSEFHDLRDPETAPDLHQFPPRYNDLFRLRQERSDEQHRRGVIVHCHGRLRSGNTAYRLLKIQASFASFPRLQIKLKIRVSSGNLSGMQKHLPSRGALPRPVWSMIPVPFTTGIRFIRFSRHRISRILFLIPDRLLPSVSASSSSASAAQYPSSSLAASRARALHRARSHSHTPLPALLFPSLSSGCPHVEAVCKSHSFPSSSLLLFGVKMTAAGHALICTPCCRRTL